METENKNTIDGEMIFGMFGAMGANLKRAIIIFSFIGLFALNIATLVSSTVHDLLYKGLTSIPITNMAEILADSPTSKKKRLASDLKAEKKKVTANKLKVKNVTRNVTKRTVRATAVNVGSMFSEAVPYLGIATIIGATTYEVKMACDNITEMDALLVSLDMQDDQVEVNKVCGKKIPSAEEIKSSVIGTQEERLELQNKLGDFLDDLKERSNSKWDEFNEDLGGTLNELLH